MNQTTTNQDDFLWRQLKSIPAFRGLLRAVEARFYQKVELPGPVLDLGCGDGHFAQMTFSQPLDVGIDPWWGPLNKGHRSGMYKQVLQGMGDKMPFPDNYFGSAISNSVLEHIPDIQAVLYETNRVLKPGGRFMITMPSHNFTANLGGAAFFERLNMTKTADDYRKLFNTISRHAHTDSAEVWAARLAQAGFEVERWQYYFSKEALRALEWGHVQGLPSAIMHFLTGHWIIAPWETSLKRTEQWLRPFYEEEADPEGAYVLFVVRKAANGPVPVNLPPQNPFTQAELHLAEVQSRTANSPGDTETSLSEEKKTALDSASVSDSALVERPRSRPQPAPKTQKSTLPQIGPGLISGFLLIASLLCALRGQILLTSDPTTPGHGFRWFVYAILSLLVLGVWQNPNALQMPNLQFSLPRFGEIPRRRWLYALGFFMVLFAQAQATRGSTLLAFLFWLGGGGLAFYSWLNDHVAWPAFRPNRNTVLTGTALFVGALGLRYWSLTTLPFILNGTEASLGLDVLSILRGYFHNPFATGWLTNPTLPLYLMAIPVRLFGPSVFSIRFFSPLIGALTVLAVYLLGRRLWSETVGLVSAILLLGSHFHIHYSRLGVTNAWDALAAWLALGLLALAWQADPKAEQSRLKWLLAGTAVGLNAYLYTSSHLLPLMLFGCLLLALLFETRTVWANGRHLIAMASLALLVALPQMLYYNSNPTIFMERAQSLGILDSQSGWLTREANNTGLSQSDLMGQQFWKAALAFNATLDTSPSYHAPVPLLSFGVAILFVLGLGVVLWNGRSLRYTMLFVWVAVTVVFAGMLLENPPVSHRLIIAAPALCLLAGLALVHLGELVFGEFNRGSTAENQLPQQWLLPALLVLACLLAFNESVFYYGRYRNNPTFADRNTEVGNEISNYLNRLPQDGTWVAYFYGPPSMYVSFPTIPFLTRGFEAGKSLFDVEPEDPMLFPSDAPNRVFLFLPERFEELNKVEADYPGGTLKSIPGQYASPLFYVYEVGQP